MNNNHQNSSKQPIESTSDLSWLAFCYVANELDGQARRHFEIRLEQDQVARDAVVQAVNDARLLDLALSSTDDQAGEPTCELPNRQLRPEQRRATATSKSLWPKALLAIAAAGLLTLAFTQFPSSQTETEIALNTNNSPVNSEFTEASMSLAETWADSDWQADLRVELGDVETNLTLDSQPIFASEMLEGGDQDDWMTATLIDMAAAPSSSESGS